MLYLQHKHTTTTTPAAYSPHPDPAGDVAAAATATEVATAAAPEQASSCAESSSLSPALLSRALFTWSLCTAIGIYRIRVIKVLVQLSFVIFRSILLCCQHSVFCLSPPSPLSVPFCFLFTFLLPQQFLSSTCYCCVSSAMCVCV